MECNKMKDNQIADIGLDKIKQMDHHSMSVNEKALLFDSLMEAIPFLKNKTKEEAMKFCAEGYEGYKKTQIGKILSRIEIDYVKEKEIFLNNASKTESKSTKDGYRYALIELENYCMRLGLSSPVLLTPKTADDYIYYLKNTAVNKFGKNLSNSTVRRDIAGASSFFTFLARRYDSIKNVFIGTKARPEKKLSTKPIYPTKEEVEQILAYIGKGDKSPLQKELASIVYIMAKRGLRCGAFESMEVTRQDNPDGTTRYIFESASKGKSYKGVLPDLCIQGMARAGIKTGAKSFRPYPDWTSDKIRNYFKYYTNKLYDKTALIHGISSPYSCHDLRHYYAMQEYKANPDIYRLKELLNHADISTTAIYLRSLGADIKE